MGGTGAFSGTPDGFGRIIGIEERHRSQPHQGAVAGAVRICGARVGVLVGVPREAVQRRSSIVVRPKVEATVLPPQS
jgi:hypothetical protein